MSNKRPESIPVNYNVSGGSETLAEINIGGDRAISIQINYKDFTQSDCKIKISQSNDGKNFIDSVDTNNDPVEMALSSALSSDILQVNEFLSNFVRISYIEVSSNTGTIKNLEILTV